MTTDCTDCSTVGRYENLVEQIVVGRAESSFALWISNDSLLLNDQIYDSICTLLLRDWVVQSVHFDVVDVVVVVASVTDVEIEMMDVPVLGIVVE